MATPPPSKRRRHYCWRDSSYHEISRRVSPEAARRFRWRDDPASIRADDLRRDRVCQLPKR